MTEISGASLRRTAEGGCPHVTPQLSWNAATWDDNKSCKKEAASWGRSGRVGEALRGEGNLFTSMGARAAGRLPVAVLEFHFPLYCSLGAHQRVDWRRDLHESC